MRPRELNQAPRAPTNLSRRHAPPYPLPYLIINPTYTNVVVLYGTANVAPAGVNVSV